MLIPSHLKATMHRGLWLWAQEPLLSPSHHRGKTLPSDSYKHIELLHTWVLLPWSNKTLWSLRVLHTIFAPLLIWLSTAFHSISDYFKIIFKHNSYDGIWSKLCQSLCPLTARQYININVEARSFKSLLRHQIKWTWMKSNGGLKYQGKQYLNTYGSRIIHTHTHIQSTNEDVNSK